MITGINIIVIIVVYIYGGCFMDPQNFREPFAPFPTPPESGQGSVIVFSCAYFVVKLYTRQLIIIRRKWKHTTTTSSFYRLTKEANVETTLKILQGFWSGNIAKQTIPHSWLVSHPQLSIDRLPRRQSSAGRGSARGDVAKVALAVGGRPCYVVSLDTKNKEHVGKSSGVM